MPEPTARHHALAAEAVTGGPMLERDIVARVASLLAHVQATADDALTADALRTLDRLAADTDADPCRLDHHGYCQEHGWLEEGGCGDRAAHELLQRAGLREAVPA